MIHCVCTCTCAWYTLAFQKKEKQIWIQLQLYEYGCSQIQTGLTVPHPLSSMQQQIQLMLPPQNEGAQAQSSSLLNLKKLRTKDQLITLLEEVVTVLYSLCIT